MHDRDQVFLSYAREDLPKVRELYQGLQSRGLKVWFDQVSIGPGRWKEQIVKAIASSRYYVITISNAALRKTGAEPGFLDQELDAAYQFAKDLPVKDFTIVPVLLEDCDRGDNRLKSFQQYALHEGWEAHLDALALAIGGHPAADLSAKDERSDNEKLIAGLKSRAEAFHYAGDYEGAIQLWDAVLVLEGDSSIAWHNKGNAFRRLARYDDALTAYEKSLSLNPRQPDTLYNKGNVLAERGRQKDAIKCFDQALALRPDDEAIKRRRQTLLEHT